MPVIKNLGWTFDTASTTYDKMRPGYPAELYKALFSYLPIGTDSRVVEVGPGAGQATLPVLQTGCTLTAVEYGKNFSDLCREKFRDFPGFSVITGKFEDTSFAENSVDLVFSATAFHWIPEETGYPKVFAMLRHGGAFARFANHADRWKDNPPLAEEIDRLYERYYYKYYGTDPEPQKEFGEEQAEKISRIAEKYGFEDIRYSLFHRVRSFSPQEYTALIGTYSDHIAMEEGIRTEFFAKIEEAIQKHGGEIRLCDTIDLELARKP